MAVSGSIKSAAIDLKSKTQYINGALHSEVYGGNWSDDVGRSYLSYTENLLKIADNFLAVAENVARIEQTLDSVDEKADRQRLNSLKSAVQSI